LLYGQEFLLLNGDFVIGAEVIKDLVECDFRTASLVDNEKLLQDGEMNVRVKNNTITQFSKDVKARDAQGESVQITKFSFDDSARHFDRIEALITENKTDLYPASAYDKIIEESCMRPVYTNGKIWFEIDTVSDLLACRAYFENSLKENPL